MNDIILEFIVDDKVISTTEYPNNNEGEIKLYNFLINLNLDSKFSYYKSDSTITLSYGRTSVCVKNAPNSKTINELFNKLLIQAIFKNKTSQMYLTTQPGVSQVKYIEYHGNPTLFVVASTDENNMLDKSSKMLIDSIIDGEFNYWQSYFISGRTNSTLKLFYDGRNIRATKTVTDYIIPKVNEMRNEYLDYRNNPFRRKIQ